jgi:hypothetical protein
LPCRYATRSRAETTIPRMALPAKTESTRR